MTYQSNKPSSEEDIQLELKDRLNYPYIITEMFGAMRETFSQPVLNINTLENLIYTLYYMIPDTWIDEAFIKAVGEAVTEKIDDVRPVDCGIQFSKEFCISNSIEYEKKTTNTDYFRLLNAIINLLDRKKMLVRKDKIELSEGLNLEDTLEELQKNLDIIERLGEDEEIEDALNGKTEKDETRSL